ncbi:hypothetical protein FHL15_011316 [Xylaria flabelliformis]|uniref:Nephrocystin 3-like N-terminal domain-containing protein n=1 Tax=Xylaria flabelliformis TaxID=2512241 RepID=A0A553HIM3_9PEZI|nr:hypothetical protein FHL15_011316 [Xylaria flabelliformis]
MAGERASRGPPPFILHTPAVDFIENRMSEYHPAFDVSGFRYSPTQNQFVPLTNSHVASTSTLAPPPPRPRSTPGSINSMDFWSEVFPEAMNQLNKGSLLDSNGWQWDIRRLTAWPDVQAKLDMARRDYDFRNGQRVGKFRRKMRLAMDKVAAPLQQGMKLIPDIDIISPVVSVIGLLLDVSSEVRETVNSGFDDLPEVFARIDFYFRSYPMDQNILMASVGLVLAIFKAIEEAIRFYTSSQDGHEARNSQAAIMQDNWATHQALGAILQQELVGRVEMAWIGNLLNHVLGFLGDRERNWPPGAPTPSRSTTPVGLILPMYSGPPPWAPRELWLRLHIPNFDETDLQYILHNAGETIFEDRDRAEQVLATQHFRAWIVSPGSAKLLVHGDFADTAAANRPVSPFSVLCATVVKALRLSVAEGKTISLVFFCGRHLVDDEYNGGGAMIRSLIAQLLRQFPPVSIESDPRVVMQEVERGDVTQLCALFVYLVRRLPARMTVFCLIDGINQYENEQFLHTMDEVVLALLRLVNEGTTSPWRAKFKLLLMSPQPTVEVRQVFNESGSLLHMAREADVASPWLQ